MDAWMIAKKPVPDVIRDGIRFSDQIMREGHDGRLKCGAFPVEHCRRLGDYAFRQGAAVMNMKLPILALGLGMLGLGIAPASAMPAAPLMQAGSAVLAQYYDDEYVPRRRPRTAVYPDRYFDDYSYRYPAVRGFGDRNPAPRGNMRGCTVDLGYGRYESCDKN
jgi:hypothetical protein